MKQFLVLAALTALMVSCGNKNKKAETEAQQAATAVAEAVDTHNSRNALDYWGTYKGTIPCADCPGIEVEIILDQNGSYKKTMTYLDRAPDNVFKTEGSYEWSADGRNITLTNASDGESYQVGENVLFMLDADGNRNPEAYNLNKQQ